MIKEQSDSFQNWFLFYERNIINNVKNSKSITNKLERPVDYCNLPLAKFHEDESSLGDNWKLKHLFVFIRHGQRASSNPMINTNYQYFINCSLKQFLSFKINDWKEFMNSLDRSNVPFTNFDTKGICKESQLTLLGILQMFIVGSRLKNAYKEFLKFSSPKILSTPYQRTLLSAEIIQYQLLKNEMHFNHSFRILESPSLVFCRSNSHISCQCDSLRYFYTKYYRYQSAQINENQKCRKLISKFQDILSPKVQSREETSLSSLSTLFDIISSALCASNLDEISKSNSFCLPSKGGIIDQEPWNFLYKSVNDENEEVKPILKNNKKVNQNKQLCMPLSLIVELWSCVDDLTEKVNNYKYFRKYSKLAVYPILNDLISRVTTLANNSIKNEHSIVKNKNSDLLLFVGHDHTLRYLLTALDFKSSMDKSIHGVINLWPGFSSRLVIEIFEKIDKNILNNSTMKFRLLYNGLIITSALTFCPSDQQACDFHLLKNYLYGRGFWIPDMFSSTNYSEECTNI